MYHDSLIWRIIALGANERCLPVILLTSNRRKKKKRNVPLSISCFAILMQIFCPVGLLYAQRDPSLIRPVSRGIQRCLVRWLVQEQMQMSPNNLLEFKWQRAFRGRSYRHLMLQLGYK
ncbi:hypothetical protein ACFE04_028220 [Oxalis oulophora]